MKKIILILFALLSFNYSSKAQDLKAAFMSMPNEFIIPIDATQKTVLLETPSDSSNIVIQNTLGGSIERLGISSDYINFKTSDIGNTQIKLLPLINSSYIIAMVQTVCDSVVCDSQISFFTTDWKPLNDSEIFPQKQISWFVQPLTENSDQNLRNAYTALDMTPVTLQFSPNNTTLEAIYNIEGYLSEDDYKLLKPYLVSKSKVFNWDKSIFK